MSKQVVLTGIRANNDLTLGNYFGAILPTIDTAKKLGDKYQVNLFIPDLHSITTPIDYSVLQKQVMHNVRVFLAAGLPTNNEDIFVYRQSYIPAHSELTWILSCFTGFGEMSRMTQFKEKSSSLGADRTSVGLYTYRILMAVDILLYDSAYVPVGDDQTQHLEFTRDIATRMNNRFGDLFTVPVEVKKQHEFFGKDQGLRIKDLQDPLKKMSKSDESGKGVIFLHDDPAQAEKKVLSATTDSLQSIHFDWDEQPGITNLLQILALLKGEDQETVNKEWEGKTSYGEFKQAVAEEVKKFLTDFQAKLNSVSDEAVNHLLERSESAMQEVANKKVAAVQKAVGLR